MRLLIVLCLLWPGAFAQRDAVGRVNPLIGTQRSAVGYGGTMPFVTTPFGMTEWTAQTRQNKIGRTSYNYDDATISGFMGTHQPAIWMGDFGYVTVMPEVGELRTSAAGRQLGFTHKDEVARPDFYAVALDAGGGKVIRAEMTATARCALLRFTFPKASAGGCWWRCRGQASRGVRRRMRRRGRLRGSTRSAWTRT